MRTMYRRPQKILAVVLTVLTMVGVVSAGLSAFAASNSLQTLAEAIRRPEVKEARLQFRHSTSPDVRDSLNPVDPLAQSQAYSTDVALWEVMDAFWAVAKSVRKTEKGTLTITTDGYLDEGSTGQNNTSKKIAKTIITQLLNGGYLDYDELNEYNVSYLFDWFVGNNVAEYSLVDEPLTSSKQSLLPWTHQLYNSTGSFGVSRTRDQALFAGERDINKIPDTLTLNQRWSWAHIPRHAQATSTGLKGTTYRQYWHYLDSMKAEENSTVQGLNFSAKEANTKDLKATFKGWKALFDQNYLTQDLRNYSSQQLEAIENTIDSAIQIAEKQKIGNALLFYYDLPTYMDVADLQENIKFHKQLAPYRPAINFFKNRKTDKELKKMSDRELTDEFYEAYRTAQTLDYLLASESGEVIEALTDLNGLDMDAPKVYMQAILQSLSAADFTTHADWIFNFVVRKFAVEPGSDQRIYLDGRGRTANNTPNTPNTSAYKPTNPATPAVTIYSSEDGDNNGRALVYNRKENATFVTTGANTLANYHTNGYVSPWDKNGTREYKVYRDTQEGIFNLYKEFIMRWNAISGVMGGPPPKDGLIPTVGEEAGLPNSTTAAATLKSIYDKLKTVATGNTIFIDPTQEVKNASNVVLYDGSSSNLSAIDDAEGLYAEVLDLLQQAIKDAAAYDFYTYSPYNSEISYNNRWYHKDDYLPGRFWEDKLSHFVDYTGGGTDPKNLYLGKKSYTGTTPGVNDYPLIGDGVVPGAPKVGTLGPEALPQGAHGLPKPPIQAPYKSNTETGPDNTPITIKTGYIDPAQYYDYKTKKFSQDFIDELTKAGAPFAALVTGASPKITLDTPIKDVYEILWKIPIELTTPTQGYPVSYPWTTLGGSGVPADPKLLANSGQLATDPEFNNQINYYITGDYLAVLNDVFYPSYFDPREPSVKASDSQKETLDKSIPNVKSYYTYKGAAGDENYVWDAWNPKNTGTPESYTGTGSLSKGSSTTAAPEGRRMFPSPLKESEIVSLKDILNALQNWQSPAGRTRDNSIYDEEKDDDYVTKLYYNILKDSLPNLNYTAPLSTLITTHLSAASYLGDIPTLSTTRSDLKQTDADAIINGIKALLATYNTSTSISSAIQASPVTTAATPASPPGSGDTYTVWRVNSKYGTKDDGDSSATPPTSDKYYTDYYVKQEINLTNTSLTDASNINWDAMTVKNSYITSFNAFYGAADAGSWTKPYYLSPEERPYTVGTNVNDDSYVTVGTIHRLAEKANSWAYNLLIEHWTEYDKIDQGLAADFPSGWRFPDDAPTGSAITVAGQTIGYGSYPYGATHVVTLTPSGDQTPPPHTTPSYYSAKPVKLGSDALGLFPAGYSDLFYFFYNNTTLGNPKTDWGINKKNSADSAVKNDNPYNAFGFDESKLKSMNGTFAKLWGRVLTLGLPTITSPVTSVDITWIDKFNKEFLSAADYALLVTSSGASTALTLPTGALGWELTSATASSTTTHGMARKAAVTEEEAYEAMIKILGTIPWGTGSSQVGVADPGSSATNQAKYNALKGATELTNWSNVYSYYVGLYQWIARYHVSDAGKANAWKPDLPRAFFLITEDEWKDSSKFFDVYFSQGKMTDAEYTAYKTAIKGTAWGRGDEVNKDSLGWVSTAATKAVAANPPTTTGSPRVEHFDTAKEYNALVTYVNYLFQLREREYYLAQYEKEQAEILQQNAETVYDYMLTMRRFYYQTLYLQKMYPPNGSTAPTGGATVNSGNWATYYPVTIFGAWSDYTGSTAAADRASTVQAVVDDYYEKYQSALKEYLSRLTEGESDGAPQYTTPTPTTTKSGKEITGYNAYLKDVELYWNGRAEISKTYDAYFNYYRLSMKQVTSVTNPTPNDSTKDWNRFTDEQLRAELEETETMLLTFIDQHMKQEYERDSNGKIQYWALDATTGVRTGGKTTDSTTLVDPQDGTSPQRLSNDPVVKTDGSGKEVPPKKDFFLDRTNQKNDFVDPWLAYLGKTTEDKYNPVWSEEYVIQPDGEDEITQTLAKSNQRYTQPEDDNSVRKAIQDRILGSALKMDSSNTNLQSYTKNGKTYYEIKGLVKNKNEGSVGDEERYYTAKELAKFVPEGQTTLRVNGFTYDLLPLYLYDLVETTHPYNIVPMIELLREVLGYVSGALVDVETYHWKLMNGDILWTTGKPKDETWSRVLSLGSPPTDTKALETWIDYFNKAFFPAFNPTQVGDNSLNVPTGVIGWKVTASTLYKYARKPVTEEDMYAALLGTLGSSIPWASYGVTEPTTGTGASGSVTSKDKYEALATMADDKRDDKWNRIVKLGVPEVSGGTVSEAWIDKFNKEYTPTFNAAETSTTASLATPPASVVGWVAFTATHKYERVSVTEEQAYTAIMGQLDVNIWTTIGVTKPTAAGTTSKDKYEALTMGLASEDVHHTVKTEYGASVDWLPTRGVGEGALVMRVGRDEFKIKYEHIENLINKLDTLLTSNFIKDLLSGPDALINLGLSSDGAGIQSSSGASTQGENDEGYGYDSLPKPTLHLPPMNGEFLVHLGEMRYSEPQYSLETAKTQKQIQREKGKYLAQISLQVPKFNGDVKQDWELTDASDKKDYGWQTATKSKTVYAHEIRNQNTGVSIILPPMDTLRDTDRIADKGSGTKAHRRYIQAYRGDVLLYLVHYIFSAINTGDTDGDENKKAWEMLAYLLKMFMSSEATSVNGAAPGVYLQELEPPAGMANIQAEMQNAVTQAITQATASLDLSAAMKPFATDLLGGIVNGILLDDMIPNIFFGLYGTVCNEVAPLLYDYTLVQNPKNPKGNYFIKDVVFFADLTLYSIFDKLGLRTLNDTINSDLFRPILGGSKNPLETLLGAQITPRDVANKCWPEYFPKSRSENEIGRLMKHYKELFKNDPDLSTAPAYQNTTAWDEALEGELRQFAGRVADVNTWLMSASFANRGNRNATNQIGSDLFAWFSKPKLKFDWGIKSISNVKLRRAIFLDVMGLSFSGITFLLAAVFGNTELTVGFLDPDSYKNGTGYKDDRWEFMWYLKTNPPEKITEAAILKETIGKMFKWSGKYDSRAGLTAIISPADLYGKVFIPLFETLNIDRKLYGKYNIHDADAEAAIKKLGVRIKGGYEKKIASVLNQDYTEKNVNYLIEILASNVPGVVRALNNTSSPFTYAQAKGIMNELSMTLVEILFVPLLNFAAPVESTSYPYSLGYRPLGKILDLLPNLAFVAEKGLLRKAMDGAIKDLKVSLSISIGGLIGDAAITLLVEILRALVKTLTYLLTEWFPATAAGPFSGWKNMSWFNPIKYVMLILYGAAYATAFLLGGALLVGLLAIISPIIAMAMGALAALSIMFGNRIHHYDLESRKNPSSKYRTESDGFYWRDPQPGELDEPARPGDTWRPPGLGALLGAFAGNLNLSFDITTLGLGGIVLGALDGNLPKFIGKQIGLKNLDGKFGPLIQDVLGMVGFTDGKPGKDFSGDFDEDLKKLQDADGLLSKQSDLMGVVIELFNPQTYPSPDYLRYALLKNARNAQFRMHEALYSDIWTRQKALYLAQHLLPFLDNLWDFLFAKDFVSWLREMLKGLLDIDLGGIYSSDLLKKILGIIGGAVGGINLEGIFSGGFMEKLLPVVNQAQDIINLGKLDECFKLFKYVTREDYPPVYQPKAEPVAPTKPTLPPSEPLKANGDSQGSDPSTYVPAMKPNNNNATDLQKKVWAAWEPWDNYFKAMRKYTANQKAYEKALKEYNDTNKDQLEMYNQLTMKLDLLRAQVNFKGSNRTVFVKTIYEMLAPLAPVLKILFTGGRTMDRDGKYINTLWYGEVYPNNGAPDLGYYAPSKDMPEYLPNGEKNPDYVNGTSARYKGRANKDGTNTVDYVYNYQRWVRPDTSVNYNFVNQAAIPPIKDKGFKSFDYRMERFKLKPEDDGTELIPYQADDKAGQQMKPSVQVDQAHDNLKDRGRPIVQSRSIYGADDFVTIGAEGNNITLLEDYLGFSGYDGWKQALIPLYEHLGVPQKSLPDYQQFVYRATDPTPYASLAGLTRGDTEFFRMLLDPLFDELDRLTVNPVPELIRIVPNLLYFVLAEDPTEYPNEQYPYVSGSQNLNEVLNRLLRPVYAILDMIQPLMTKDELFGMLGLSFPMKIMDGVELTIPLEISVNKIVHSLIGSISVAGFEIVLPTDLMVLVSGMLSTYESKNGQTDAVKLEIGIEDILTHLFRMIFKIFLTPENRQAVIDMLDGMGLPKEVGLRDFILGWVDGLLGLLSDDTLGASVGPDMILSILFYLFYDADTLVKDLLTMRDSYSARIISLFEYVANSRNPELRRYAERTKRILDEYYPNIISTEEGLQPRGAIEMGLTFFQKVAKFFKDIGNWFLRLLKWLFPFFFK